MDDGICTSDVSKKLISQSFPLTCPFNQTSNVNNFNCCWNNALWVDQFLQCYQTVIRYRYYAYIGLDGTEGEICRLRLRITECIK